MPYGFLFFFKQVMQKIFVEKLLLAWQIFKNGRKTNRKQTAERRHLLPYLLDAEFSPTEGHMLGSPSALLVGQH